MPRYIDADALIADVMERYCSDCDKRKGIKRGKWRTIYEIGEAPCRACSVDDMKSEIDDAPTADVVERKKGKWVIYDYSRGLQSKGNCSRCGAVGYLFYNYCPLCGTVMKIMEDEK